MLILAVDTSFLKTSVALGVAKGGKLVRCIEAESGVVGSHSESLLGLVKDVLEKAALKVEQLDQLLVGAGPGSFTGLRIGFSFMKGLAFSRGLKLQSFCSLAALAYEFSDSELGSQQYWAALSDARRGEYFCRIFKRTASNNPRIEPCSEAFIGNPSLLLERLREVSVLAGDAVVAQTVFISPESIFTESTGIKTLAAEHSSWSAIELWLRRSAPELKDLISDEPGLEAASEIHLARLEPNYLRAVNAKTIAEREASAGANSHLLGS